MSSDSTDASLKKTIGLFQSSIFGIGLILGAGIYSIIGDAAGIAGNVIWISFIIAALLALTIGLSYAELSSIFPRSAAEYLFVKNAFKNEFVASFVGFLVIFVIIASSATVAVGFSGYMNIFLPNIPKVLISVILVVVLSFVNFYGISESININVLFTFIELSGLLFLIITAFISGYIFNTNYFEFPNYSTNTNSNVIIGSLLSAAGLIFFAYIGFENIVNIADETRFPSRTIPRALIISIVVTTIVYVLVALSAISLVGWQELSSSYAPLATAAKKAGGNIGIFLLSVIGLFATTNTVLVLLISGSRMIYGISNDKKSILPTVLSKIHKKRKTPWIAILFVMSISFLIIIFSNGDLSMIAGVTVFGIFTVYIIINIALITLRYKKSELKRPFTSPLRIGKFPILAGVGIVFTLLLVVQLNFEVIIKGMFSFALIFVLLIVLKIIRKYLIVKK